ncbi:hypothetical protein N9L49_04650 [Rhodospirillales bacterium]|nr:hypothetical protein [Rhodospirillales bacterium]
MIGTLKKLEAFDGGIAAVVSPSASSETSKPVRKVSEPQDRRLLTIPTDGWINGPGRSSRLSSSHALARG